MEMDFQTCEWLLRSGPFAPIGVCRERMIIYGCNLAEVGAFKSLGRGSFDLVSLDLLAELANRMESERGGVPCNSDHGFSAGRFLGWIKNVRTEADRLLRGDLHICEWSERRGSILLDLLRTCELAPESLGMSAVLHVDKSGPAWRPSLLRRFDVVTSGDSCHSGILGPKELRGGREVVARDERFVAV